MQIASSNNHTCALDDTGRVWCWGWNHAGQLGDGSVNTRTRPVRVQGLSGVAEIAAGNAHSCARLTNGRVRCWGANTNGQLGDGTTTRRLTPVEVSGLRSAGGLSLGLEHSCAVQTTGSLRCWGRNTHGQLGDGTTVQRLTPVRIASLGSRVAQVALGGRHTCAMLTTGRARCWGNNEFGQLGDGTTTNRLTPVAVLGVGQLVAQLAAGQDHACARQVNGRLRCWGANFAGQLGDGTAVNRPTPVVVGGISRTVGHALGASHTCARHENGRLRCWGANPFGQLGDGSTTWSRVPVIVARLGTSVLQVTAGSQHTCALVTGGQVRCWGENGLGQVGDGTNIQRNRAVPVQFPAS